MSDMPMLPQILIAAAVIPCISGAIVGHGWWRAYPRVLDAAMGFAVGAAIGLWVEVMAAVIGFTCYALTI